MTTRGETLHAPADLRGSSHGQPPTRLPLVVYVLALGTFLMGTTEFVVAGLLPEIAGDVQVSVAQAGLLITVFAVGMIVGAPLMAMLTLRLPPRLTLILALGIFAAGHVFVALSSSFALLLAARFLTALATGAFWAVANVVAARAAGPAASSRALGVVGSRRHARQRRRRAARRFRRAAHGLAEPVLGARRPGDGRHGAHRTPCPARRIRPHGGVGPLRAVRRADW